MPAPSSARRAPQPHSAPQRLTDRRAGRETRAHSTKRGACAPGGSAHLRGAKGACATLPGGRTRRAARTPTAPFRGPARQRPSHGPRPSHGHRRRAESSARDVPRCRARCADVARPTARARSTGARTP